MKVVTRPGVTDLIKERGGRLYVWTDAARCQAGKMMLLLTSSEPPDESHEFGAIDVDGFELHFDPGRNTPPNELVLEVKGWRKKHVEAYWDGLAFPV